MVVTEENWEQIFRDHFFDARRHAPKQGQIMAKYTAMAELAEGQLKNDLVMLLKMNKAEAAAKVMQKLGGAVEPDNFRVCREICEDMLSGMSEEEIKTKPYKFKFEQMFYTEREYVPEGDPHWETIKLLFNPNEYMKHIDELNAKAEIQEENED